MIKLEKLLKNVEKPARYLGNELHSIRKENCSTTFCIIYPDIYEIGMSNMGTQILYGVLNNTDDISCERCYTPGVDMEKALRESGTPLFSLESKKPLKEFDMIGFSLSYEMTYTNVLNMLDMAGIAIERKGRKETDPIITAGGTGAYNPAVMEQFIDCFLMGDGEEIIKETVEFIRENKSLSRDEKLKALSKIEGVYVPKYYDGGKIRKRVVKDMDKAFSLEKVIVPYMGVIHDRYATEVMRGCTRGCRFCQAGMVYRPVREKSVEQNLKTINSCLQSSGHNDVSLSSLSSSDYSSIEELIDGIKNNYADMNIGISLPSLRIDTFSVQIAKEIEGARKTGFTFAPEAGSQRMRDVINKGVNEEDIIKTAVAAINAGWRHFKFYFMIGLPYETMEDVKEILVICQKVLGECLKIRRDIDIVVSVSNFVPKTHTPFQWDRQMSMEEMNEKHNYLKDLFRRQKRLTLRIHDKKLTFLEGFIARGDKRTGNIIKRAWENGAKFDGWGEHFNYEAWTKAIEAEGAAEEDYFRERDINETLPWDFVDTGIDRNYMIEERKKAKECILTSDCRLGCTGCGVCMSLGVEMKIQK